MELNDYLELIKPDVEQLFKDDQSGHDILHLERTLKSALYIQKHEGGNLIVVGLSAFLHDVHRIIQPTKGDFASPKDSLPIIEQILNKTDLDTKTKQQILDCVEYHECYNWSDPENKNRSLEAHILQDADNLDAIGAIGIIRSFNYGIMRNIPMYNANEPLVCDINYVEDHDTKESVIHYFYNKLFRLGDNMNTKTGKKLAHKRIKFMHKFVKQFIAEHESKFWFSGTQQVNKTPPYKKLHYWH